MSKRTKAGKKRSKIILNTLCIVAIGLTAVLLAISMLTQSGASLFGIRSYIVLTGSMSPSIEAGSYIFVKERPASDIEPGDVISYITSDGESMLTHRVIERNVVDGEVTFITQGDANNTADERPVPYERVQGVNFAAIPYLGSLLLALKTPSGLALCVGIIAVVFLASWLYRKLTYEEEKDDGELRQESDQGVKQMA